VAGEMRNACAPDLILAGQAGNGGTGATDPTALNDSNALPRSGQMPGEALATLSAAEDQEIVMFWLRHEFSSFRESKAMRSSSARHDVDVPSFASQAGGLEASKSSGH